MRPLHDAGVGVGGVSGAAIVFLLLVLLVEVGGRGDVLIDCSQLMPRLLNNNERLPFGAPIAYFGLAWQIMKIVVPTHYFLS